MRYGRIAYMNWTKQTYSNWPEGAVDFGASGVPMPVQSLHDLGIDTSKLPLGGPNHYGYAKLREGLANRYGVEPTQVIPTEGTSMANFILLAALTTPGDSILVESPVYECMSGPVESLGCNISWLERREENGWVIDIDQIKSMMNEKTRGIFISNCHNPTGQYTPDEVIIEIADILGEDRFVLVDEVYREGLPDQNARTVALKRANIFSTSSLTKVWGFGALRCGWAIAPEAVIKKMYLAYDHMGVVTPFLSNWISGELVSDATLLNDYRQKALDHLAESRKLVDDFLATGDAERIHTIAPAAGGVGFWRIEGMDGDTIADRLLAEAGVFVVPGKYFRAPEGFRVGWTQGPEVTEQALALIAEWLRSL